MPNPFGDIADFFSGLIGGGTQNIAQGVTALPSAITNWFASIGGMIASGLEAGIVALLKDIWNVILGPIEISVGAILIIFALFVAFKDDLFGAAAMVGMAAA